MTEQTTETEVTTDPEPDAQTTDTTEQDEQDDPETFPREYVTKLREEAAKHRQKAADRDDLAQRLHTALVTATGRLADASDLPFDETHLTGEDTLTAAIDDLLERKPHLASRRVTGDVGQGQTGATDAFDLAGILRRTAS